MGIPLGGGLPPDGGESANPNLARHYYVKRRTAGKAFTLGPFRAQRAPISGAERMAMSVGPMSTADERLFFAKTAQVAQADVLQCLETGQNWSVVFVQVWPERVIAWIAREGIALAGNVSGAQPT